MWPTRTGRPGLAFLLVPIVGLAILVITAHSAGISLQLAREFIPRSLEILKGFIVMPDWRFLPTLGQGMIDTLRMAFLATVVAVPISFLLGLAASRRSDKFLPLVLVSQGVLGLLRSVPDLVWALAFVSALGLGDVPGIAALIVTTVAYLSKFNADIFDAADPGQIEAMKAHGAGWAAQQAYGLVPQTFSAMVGRTAYSLDSNVRTATILGYVGAGGIGYDLNNSIRILQYNRLGLIIVSIILVVLALDRLAEKVTAWQL